MNVKISYEQPSEKSWNPIKKLTPDNIYYYNYWIYVYIGFWTYKSPVEWHNKLYRMYQRTLIAIYSFVIIFFIIDAFVVRHDLQKLSFNLSGSVLVFLTLMKAALLIQKIDVVEDILEKMENNLYVETLTRSPRNKEIYRKRAAILCNITRFFYVLLAIAYPLRLIADTALEKTYLIPIPYGNTIEEYYPYVYSVEAVISTHFMVTVISHDMFVYGIIIRYIEHLDLLEVNLLDIKDLYPRKNFEEFVWGYREGEERKAVPDVLIKKSNDLRKVQDYLESHRQETCSRDKQIGQRKQREERTYELLKQNIHHHQKLLKEVERFSRVYSLSLLVQTWGFVTLIGISIIQVIILSGKVTPLLVQQTLYVGTSMTNLLHLCTFGSELSTKSCEIADVLYDIPWYEMGEKNKKAILYMIQKFIKSPKLTAGGVFTINRITYLKFMQTSYNVVAVMRNVY